MKGIMKMAEQAQEVEKIENQEEEKLDEIRNRLIKNYEVVGKRLGDILKNVDRVFTKPGWVKKGRKILPGWDARKEENIRIVRAIERIKKLLIGILQWLDSIESVELKVENRVARRSGTRERRDRKKVIYFCFEKLGGILARFDKIWVQSEKLEERKEKILGSKSKIKRFYKENRGLDGMLQEFMNQIRGETALIFTEPNKRKIKEIKEELEKLKSVNEELIGLITEEGDLVKDEWRLVNEEEELIRNLVKGMKQHEQRLRASMAGYSAFGFPRRAEKVRDVLQTYEGFSIPREFEDRLTHFKTDLAAEELKILHMEITRRIVMIYNATVELWKLLKEENTEIENLIKYEGEVQKIQKVPSKKNIKPGVDRLAYDTHESLKKLSSIFYNREMPLAGRVKAIQNAIKRAYDNVKKIEDKRQHIEEVGWLRRRAIKRQLEKEAGKDISREEPPGIRVG